MKNSLGTNIILTLFGESHGPAVGAVLDGFPAGLPVSVEEIAEALNERRPKDRLDTARREKDDFQVLSGVFNGYTCGTPVCIMIPNGDVRSESYEEFRNVPRPSHADYSAFVKYHGFEDYRGGGHFSGRVTAAIVAAGAIALKALKNKGVGVSSELVAVGGRDSDFDSVISEAVRNGDSVGGLVCTTVHSLPAGVGEPWFDSLEGEISKAVFSIGGVKGIEFGSGFGLCSMRGSEANDAFYVENGQVLTHTNHSGGINGGISNGMDIVFRTAVKPTPSIAQSQMSVDITTGEQAVLNVRGRHDPCIARRVSSVINAVTALVICDLLASRYGSEYFLA